MRIFAHHGVSEQEQTVGNWFEVDVAVWLDVTEAVHSDNVNDTVSYADLAEIVRCEMAVPSNLIEHVAGRILRSVKRKLLSVGKVEVVVAKLHPPIDTCTGFAKVVLRG